MKIALLGDIGFFGKYTFDNPDIKKYFKSVSNLLSAYDLVVGNLETPFVGDLKPKLIKSACIGALNHNVELLNYLNVGCVNLANNHLLDYGKEGYDLTLKLLEENNINYFGIEDKIYNFKKDFNAIAFHGYCAYNTSPAGMYTKKKGYGVNVLDFKTVLNNFKDLDSQGFLNFLSIHSGQEHINIPSYEDIKMARQLAKIAPYVYYGHHPHVLQGLEKINDAVIAYSLGNFCFDDIYTPKSKEALVVQTENNKSSMILEIEIMDNKIVNHKAIPVFAGDNEIEVGSKIIEKNLEGYSDKLKMKERKYTKERNTEIRNFVNDRKQMRNFSWYVKRLNFQSFVRIYDAKMNIKKQYDCVSKHFLN
ncbi:CapA family protein [Flavobacteriaceae bacterium]|nr:CapA family protein [Flavobacteriaceae bacterium]